MVQRYFPRAAESIYSITGFIDETGELFAARAAVKVFQRTRPVGLGLAFAAAPLDLELAGTVARLCRVLGYFGVFEVEFVRADGRRMVIDFNPRFYGQMAFDVARGLPLPLLAWHAARGDRRALAEGIAGARRAPDDGAAIYCHRFVFELALAAQRLSGSMTRAERDRWREWYHRHRSRAVDASADARDWLPGLVHAAAEVAPGLRALGGVIRASHHLRGPAGPCPSSRGGAHELV